MLSLIHVVVMSRLCRMEWDHQKFNQGQYRGLGKIKPSTSYKFEPSFSLAFFYNFSLSLTYPFSIEISKNPLYLHHKSPYHVHSRPCL